MEICDNVLLHWEALHTFIQGKTESPDRGHPGGMQLLQDILNVALQISLMMSNNSTKQQVLRRSSSECADGLSPSMPVLDLKYSLLPFFERKSLFFDTQLPHQ